MLILFCTSGSARKPLGPPAANVCREPLPGYTVYKSPVSDPLAFFSHFLHATKYHTSNSVNGNQNQKEFPNFLTLSPTKAPIRTDRVAYSSFSKRPTKWKKHSTMPRRPCWPIRSSTIKSSARSVGCRATEKVSRYRFGAALQQHKEEGNIPLVGSEKEYI